MNNVQFVERSKTVRVIRFVEFSELRDPENFYCEHILLYYPFFEEEELLLVESYYEHACHKVIVVVGKIAHKYERWRTAVKDAESALYHEETEELVRKAEERFGKNLTPFDDEECNQESVPITSTVENEEECFSSRIRIPCTMSNEDFRTLVASLKEKQPIFLYETLFRERYRLFNNDQYDNFSFPSGGAGSCKSATLKDVFQCLLRLFQNVSNNDVDCPCTAFVSYTGTASRNVNGTTIHTFLGLKFGTDWNSVNAELSSSTLRSYPTKLQNLRVLLVDEASYIGCRTLHTMDQRHCDIKQVDAPFGGVTVIFFGDLFRLKPDWDGPIFCNFTKSALKHAAFYVPVWNNYRMSELTEIKRQSDRDWIELLNRVRLGKHNETELSRINQLVGRIVPPNTDRACYLRRNAQKFNEQHLAKVHLAHFTIAQSNVREHASCTKDIRQQLLDRAKEISLNYRGLTVSLSYSIPLALNQYFMIILNMDKEDGLVNGSLGLLKAVSIQQHKNLEVPELLWFVLDDKLVGKAAREKYQTTHRSKVEKQWTPVERVVKDFTLGLSSRLEDVLE